MSDNIYTEKELLNEIEHLPDNYFPAHVLKMIKEKTQSGEMTKDNANRLKDKLLIDYLRDRKAIQEELSKKIVVIDSIMGSGKSTYVLNYIKNNPYMKFICVVPTKNEIARYMKAINDEDEGDKPKRIVCFEPKSRPTKTQTLQYLIMNNRNIVTTHSLISRINLETMKLLRKKNYTLIIDECLDVVHEYKELKPSDIVVLFNAGCVEIDNQGFLKWKDDAQDHDGKYENEKNLCNLNSLMATKNKNGEWSKRIFIWTMPVSFFSLFEKCYICTYLFDGSLQSSYFKLNHINYKHMTLLNGVLVPYNSENELMQRKERFQLMKIHHNFNGDSEKFKGKSLFTKTWYKNEYNQHKDKEDRQFEQFEKLKKNTVNFFQHITNTPSSENMYTTFKSYKSFIAGKGYTKGFVPCNTKGTNDYSHKSALAYLINYNPPQNIVKFFDSHGITVNKDMYALCEMLQWIWRSRIRNGLNINIYIPSVRMRELLGRWYQCKI